jgi:hypothetical protein
VDQKTKSMIQMSTPENAPPNLRNMLSLSFFPLTIIVVASLTVMGLAPASRWSAISALIVTGISAAAGGAVVAWVWRKWPAFLPQAVLAAMGVRMLSTLVGILVFVLILGNREVRFFMYTIVFYLVGLACETVIAVSKLSVGKDHLPASRGKEL